MCYTGSCCYEDWQGECRKPRRELCPLEYEEDCLDGAERDMLCDELYEKQRDARLEATW